MVNNIINRIDKVKNKLNDLDLDAILVSKSENQIYLSNFPSSNCTIIISKDKNYLLTDSRYIEAARNACPMYDVVLLKDGLNEYDFIKSLKLGNLGVEKDVLTINNYSKLIDFIGNTKVTGCDGIIEGIRVIKDETELAAINKAIKLTDDCYSYILSFVKEGMTEKEVALEVQLFFLKNGATGLSFDTICVSGKRTSLPHGIPTDNKLEKGDFVTLDMGCIIDGYCSDMTRTFAIGSVTKEQEDVYNIVLKAQQNCLDNLKAGMTYKDGDRLTRDIIEEAGYGDYFGHGTGHGVGLEIHEAPTLSLRAEGILLENMLVTVEPGIYIPGKFGVRIEDLAIVTSFGIINNVQSSKELIII